MQELPPLITLPVHFPIDCAEAVAVEATMESLTQVGGRIVTVTSDPPSDELPDGATTVLVELRGVDRARFVHLLVEDDRVDEIGLWQASTAPAPARDRSEAVRQTPARGRSKPAKPARSAKPAKRAKRDQDR